MQEADRLTVYHAIPWLYNRFRKLVFVLCTTLCQIALGSCAKSRPL